MIKKIMKLTFAAAFAGMFVLLLGSMPFDGQKNSQQQSYELQKINNSAKNAIYSDFSELQEKNPLILLEFSVE